MSALKLAVICLLMAIMSEVQGVHWTGWLDRDNPSGTGDYEQYGQFSPVPCSGFAPLRVEARVKGSSGIQDNNVKIGHTYGLTCVKADQSDNTCHDYEVRFLCSFP